MKTVHRYVNNRKGINTILAALLMVVIVVVASVMVYAWSTGLLGSLMGGGTGNVGKEALNLDSYAFNPNNYNVTLYVRNLGSVATTLQAYYVKDSAGNSWQLQSWSPAGQPINPNAVSTVFVTIGAGASPPQCGSTCQYTGTPGAFTSFVAGNSYTILVVTTRNTQFTFTCVR
jgi:hypothetical protein